MKNRSRVALPTSWAMVAAAISAGIIILVACVNLFILYWVQSPSPEFIVSVATNVLTGVAGMVSYVAAFLSGRKVLQLLSPNDLQAALEVMHAVMIPLVKRRGGKDGDPNAADDDLRICLYWVVYSRWSNRPRGLQQVTDYVGATRGTPSPPLGTWVPIRSLLGRAVIDRVPARIDRTSPDESAWIADLAASQAFGFDSPPLLAENRQVLLAVPVLPRGKVGRIGLVLYIDSVFGPIATDEPASAALNRLLFYSFSGLRNHIRDRYGIRAQQGQ